MTFSVGDAVQVAARSHPGHHRTPRYLKGRRGTIARVHGTFKNPETRAYGADGEPRVRLYFVEFREGDVWTAYSEPFDRVYADLFEHWLEPAS